MALAQADGATPEPAVPVQAQGNADAQPERRVDINEYVVRGNTVLDVRTTTRQSTARLASRSTARNAA